MALPAFTDEVLWVPHSNRVLEDHFSQCVQVVLEVIEICISVYRQ